MEIAPQVGCVVCWLDVMVVVEERKLARHLWEAARAGQGGRRVMEGERLSWELARSSPGAPPRCVCLLRILSFYSLCRVELFTHKNQQR